jgi:tetratricopeptide (TPR) repeat protein
MRFESNFWAFILFCATIAAGAGPAFAQAPPAADEPAVEESEAEKSAAEETADEDSGAEDSGAEDARRYEELTKQAAEAYRSGDYAGAVELFEQAYALNPVPNLLYNIGRAEEKRGDFPAAIAHYEKFVTQPGVAIKARQNALARLKTLREVVELSAPDKTTDPQKTDESTARQPAAVDSPPQSATRIEPNYTPAWITLGVAAAAYATSGVFAWQARQAHADFRDATSRGSLRDAAAWGETASVVADSALIVGVVATGLGVYFLASPFEHEAPARSSAMRLSPRIGADGAGVTWAVSF